MTGKKMRHIRGVLATVNSQRVEYKPYSYGLSFSETLMDKESVLAPKILVELEIPEDCVLESGTDFVVLGLDGLQAILSVTADAIDTLNEQFKKSKKGD